MDVLAWVRVQMMVMDAASALVSFAANWLLQSTLLIAAGLAAARLLRGRGAATQSAIFRTTLAAALACPLATSLLARCGVSGWSLEMPTAWTYEEFPATVADDAATAAIDSQFSLPAAEPMMDDEMRIAGASLPMDAARDAAVFAPQPPFGDLPPGVRDTEMAERLAPAGEAASVSPTVARQAASARAPTATFNVRAFGLAAIGMALAWLAASAVLLLRLLRAWRRLHQLRGAAAPAELAAQNECRELATLLNVSAPELLRTPYLASPCLAGLRRPAVLLPEANPSLPIRDVLIHELAHLRRRDGDWNLLRRLAEAAFFYQPLLWLLARRLEAAAEEVCDDYVVHFGGNRERYARGLVEIAELSVAPLSAAGVAMVSLRSILARRIVRILDSSRSLSTRVGNLLLAVVIAAGLGGVMAAGFVGLGSQRSQAEAQASDDDAATRTDGNTKGDSIIAENAGAKGISVKGGAEEAEFAGVVTDAEGKPVADSEIWLVASVPDEADLLARPILRRLAHSDQQGRFAFRLAPIRREGQDAANWTSSLDLIAKAPGHGYDWLPLAVFEKNPAPSSERDVLQQRVDKALGEGRFVARTLKLPHEAGPVQGRLIDLEGRPLADVTVSVDTIQAPDLATLDRAFESSLRDLYYRAINGDFNSSQATRQAWQTLMPSVKTNQNGEFSLSGLGAGQMATVTLAGERVAAERLYIMGREMETKRLPHIKPDGAKDVFVGVRFTHAVGPGRAVVGRVTEFQSGQPIAGARVFVERLFRHDDRIDSAGRLRLDTRHIQAVTDEQGRFRLIGIPPGTGHVLNVVAPKSEPWLMAEQEFSLDSDSPARNTEVDVQVCRGIWIEGRLTDAETGEPVPGYVDYLALRKNPHTPENLGLHEAWDLHRFPTDSSGRYRVAGLQGPGVLLVRARGETVYPLCVGAEKVDGYDAENGFLPTTPTGLPLSNWNLIRQIDPPADSKSYSLDLTLAAGVTLTGRVAGPGGESPSRVEAMGLVAKDPFFRPLEGDRFSVYAYDADVARDVFFRSADNSRVAHLHLQGKPPEDMTVLLEAAVTVKGRLIETETEAEAVGYRLFCESTKQGEFRIDDVLTDENGQFEIKGLLAGNVYQMDAANPQHFINRKNGFTIDLSDAKPGDSFELGDVTGPAAKAKLQTGKNDPQPDRAAQGLMAAKNPMDNSPARASNVTTLRGRVLDPDGKPQAGAKVYFWSPGEEMSKLEPKARTAADGGFEFTADRSKLKWVSADDPWTIARIIAAADGFGYEWAEAAEPGADGQYVIRLVRDVPIHGRILSLEGQPVAKAKLTLRNVNCFLNNNLDEYIQAEKTGSRNYGPGRFGRTPPGQPDMVETDADGRFTLGGIGAERVANLLLEGEGIARANLLAMTRETETVVLPENIVFRRTPDRTFGASFTHLAQPSRLIRGVVRERETLKPIAGVTIVGVGSGMPQLTAKTDEQGKFELDGLSKQDRYFVNAMPAYIYGPSPVNSPYLAATRTIEDTPGLDPIEVDFELVRGIQVSGRVALAPDGRPNKAQVMYYPLRGNAYTNRIGPQLADPCSSATCDENGRYTIPVLPGPGILCYRIGFEIGSAHREYLQAWMSREEIAKHFESVGLPFPPELGGDNSVLIATGGPAIRSILLSNFKQVAFINPAEDATTLVSDIEFPLGRRLDVKLVDPDGKPIAGAIIRGDLNAPYHVAKSDPSEFTLVGLNPRVEQRMIVESRERKLAAYKVIRGDEPGPLTMMLEPCGTVVGRALDVEGEPLANMQLQMPRPMYLPADFMPKTDGEGRFRVAGVVPGVTYNLEVNLPGRMGSNALAQNIIVKPGETKDLGDVRIKPPAAMQRPGGFPQPGGKPPSAPGAPAKRGNGPKPPANGQQKPGARGNAPQKDEPAPALKPRADGPSQEGDRKTNATLRGRVTRDGRPASGADVAVIARKTAAVRGGDFGPSGEVLAEGKTDGNGEYSLNFVDASAKSRAYAIIIARQEGAAIAWQQHNLETVDSEIDFELPAEEPIRGKLIDLEGRPAAGVRLTVRQISNQSKSGAASGVGYQGDKVPAAWLAPVVSDEQGRFVVLGVPAAHGLFLEVGQDERFAPQEIDLSPGADEQRGERDATYRPLVKNLKPGEEAVLALSPAQPFAGTVRYADSGVPAPHARISIWASQQESFGSMISVGGRADEHGRYRISPKPGVRFGLTAYPPDGVPYLARQTSRDEPLRWNASEGVKQVDLNLPRGVLVQGTIVEAGGNRPVGGAAIQYIPESSNNPNASNNILTGWQAIQLSDRYGRFSIAVLPGPGRLLVSGQQGNYVLQPISELELSDGKPGGARNYAHAIAKLNPEVGQETLEVKLELQPGATASGRIVDEQGQAIEEATVISRLNISPYSLFWRGHTTPTLGGRFELTGLAKYTEYPVYFLDPKRKLGATEVIKAGEGERTVVLKPCGQARLRAVDKNGEPGADHVSVEMVVTPGALRYDFEAVRNGELAADADYVANIDHTNHWNRPQSDEKGTFVLPALIPGATYRVITGRGGMLKVVKEFQVQSNETLDLGEILIERIE